MVETENGGITPLILSKILHFLLNFFQHFEIIQSIIESCSNHVRGNVNGLYLSRRHTSTLRLNGRICYRLRKARRYKVTWLHIVSAVVAVGLLIYLIAALLNPEDFS